MKTSGFRIAGFLLAAILALSWTALAQVTSGNLAGVIKDESGAVMPGVNITATHGATGAVREAVTDDSGAYVFPGLPVGEYTLMVQQPGFRKLETRVLIEVGQPSRSDLVMQVGEISGEIVTVEDTQKTVNAVSSELNTNITRRQILDLPLPTRNPIDLARLQAGVAVPSGTDARNAAINGLRGNLTNITQDGINVQDNFVRTSSLFALSAPSVENTGEFSIAIGTISSQSGSGAVQVRIVTPSGTNQLHGSVFWFHRNDNLNANTFFNNQTKTPRVIQLQNRFGFRLGGPLYIPKLYDGRNRSFFFGAYEGFREPFSVTRNRTVLTPEARTGIFRYTGSNGQLQTVDLLQIAPNFKTINPVTDELIKLTPPPNNTLVGDGFNTAGFRFNVSGKNNSDRWTIRADQQLTETALGGAHKVEFVINRSKFILTPDTFNGIEARFPGGINAFQESKRMQMAAAIHSTFGTNKLNEVRYGLQRAPVGFLLEKPVPRGYFIGLTAGTTPDNTFVSQGRNTPVYTFIDNFSWVRGRHSIKFGTEIRSLSGIDFNDVGTVRLINLGSNTQNSDGLLTSQFPFLPSNTIFNNGRSVYHTLVGLLGNVGQTFNVTDPGGTAGFVPGATRRRVERYREYNFFATDDWRVNAALTLNAGLRYEYITDIDVVNKFALQPENNVASLYGISGFGNLFKPGTLGGTAVNNLVPGGRTNGRPFNEVDKNNFAPYIGFALSPDYKSGPLGLLFGTRGTSAVRGGYAVSYTREGFTVITNVTTGVNANLGLSQRVTNSTPTGVITSAGVNVTPPAFVLPRSDVDNYISSSGAAGFWTVEPNLKTPYVQQWSFGFERELPGRWAIETRYVANRANKLIQAYDINEVNIFENGFLNEFLAAKKNLDINLANGKGSTFVNNNLAGQVALPIFSALFAGVSNAAGFGNTTFINQLNTGAAGTTAFTLANSTTFRANRAKLAPNFFLANPNLNFARVTSNGAFSSYNSLQVELRRRLSTGLFFQANYTFSKALTNAEPSQSLLSNYRTLRDIGIDKHRADFDITHTFNGNYVYELPIGTGQRFWAWNTPVVRQLLEGWQVQGLVSWHTSPYKTLLSGRGTFNQFGAGNTAVPLTSAAIRQINSGTGVVRQGNGVFWLDPALLNVTNNATTGFVATSTLQPGLFAHPAAGTLGPTQINSFGSIRFFQTDFSVIKRTKIWETSEFEFRAEFFNFFNNTNFSGASADVNIDSTSFGRLTSTFDARVIQLALRINW